MLGFRPMGSVVSDFFFSVVLFMRVWGQRDYVLYLSLTLACIFEVILDHLTPLSISITLFSVDVCTIE